MKESTCRNSSSLNPDRPCYGDKAFLRADTEGVIAEKTGPPAVAGFRVDEDRVEGEGLTFHSTNPPGVFTVDKGIPLLSMSPSARSSLLFARASVRSAMNGIEDPGDKKESFRGPAAARALSFSRRSTRPRCGGHPLYFKQIEGHEYDGTSSSILSPSLPANPF